MVSLLGIVSSLVGGPGWSGTLWVDTGSPWVLEMLFLASGMHQKIMVDDDPECGVLVLETSKSIKIGCVFWLILELVPVLQVLDHVTGAKTKETR